MGRLTAWELDEAAARMANAEARTMPIRAFMPMVRVVEFIRYGPRSLPGTECYSLQENCVFCQQSTDYETDQSWLRVWRRDMLRHRLKVEVIYRSVRIGKYPPALTPLAHKTRGLLLSRGTRWRAQVQAG
jgi:hypothetical protein